MSLGSLPAHALRWGLGVVVTLAPCAWTLRSLEAQVPPITHRAVRDPSFSSGGRLELTEVLALLVGKDHEVYVADRSPAAIYYLSPDGQDVSQVAARGAGPGEARGIATLGWFRDTLWFMDPALQRVTFLSRGHRVLRTQPYRDRCPLRAPWAILDDGRCLIAIQVAPIRPGDARVFPLVAVGNAGRDRDTVLQWSTGHTLMSFEFLDGVVFVGQPFSDDPLVSVSPLGGLVAVVERPVIKSARSGTFRIRVWSPMRGWIAERDVAYRPRRIERRAVDRALDSLDARLSRMNPQHPVSRDSLRRKLYRPKYYPPATELRVARDSTLWIRLATEPPRPLAPAEAFWLVCHWTGRSLRSVVAPAHLKVFDADGDLVWGIEGDADDVPRVVRYRLVRHEGG